ncbi:aspartate ammonia-lyase [Planctomyces sp. SH-PL14]|uniref:aspartate ammonia-lyase n=1 Tax=Planctomyces sp. SH-PL14 TaxID=1632864 RepID=UPI00078E85CF|nr:aspartate ammonia-lyase [Planctomyces sp. SH-PL14]AMV18324.1 Aspartate ammonia-lyase [Planctomyces sp. SH-PL14]
MKTLLDRIEPAAVAMGIPASELVALMQKGTSTPFEGGACLFHESMPREWFGIVESGTVDIVRGLHGSQTHLATLTAGALIAEGLLLDDGAHSTSAYARGTGTSVIVIRRAVMNELKAARPDVYYRLVARVAQRISDRLRIASDAIAAQKALAPEVTSYRTEHDSLGEREIPNNVYYGVQTVRALENFAISGVPLRTFAHFVNGLACVKKAAAQANAELRCIPRESADAIVKACDEILAGRLHSHFVVDMMQGGAGTSTNMNANEVIANRALEILGHSKGEYRHLHPNDHVNCSQSTNDAYPTAIKLAVIYSLKDTLAAMDELRIQLQGKEREFAHVLKMGRTENQDAVPMTLGQEFGAYAVMVQSAMAALGRSADELHEINMGATAIGTGICSPPGYADLVTKRLVETSGLPLRKALNLVEATQDSGAFAQMAATMKRAAVQVSKICNDLRWLSSGPRCGLNEINLPPMQPGSSIMPGKVNPVIPELVSQICFQIIGYDVTISMASEASELELNMAEPIIAYDLLHGLMILKNACVTLAARCISGITANEDRCRQFVQNSIGLVTALNPVIGYEKSASIAKEALRTGGSVYDLVLEKGWLSREQLDDLLSPASMTDPRQLPTE